MERAHRWLFRTILIFFVSLAPAACGGGSGAPALPPPGEYVVSGSLTGLVGSGLRVRISVDEQSEQVDLATNGSFTFSLELPDGANYQVTITRQPSAPSQTCVVSGGTGTINAADVTSVAISCTVNTFTIGGMVSGLVGSGLVLRNNGGDDLSVSTNGTFTFATALEDLSAYSVTVLSQPVSPSQTCVASNAAGNLAGGDVTSIAIMCTTDAFTIGGTLSGLSGSGLVLQNNGGDDLGVSANGSFTFVSPLADLTNYSVTVSTQPGMPSQTCSVLNGAGMIEAANISDVTVSCTTNQYTISGTVSGLSGTGLVLQNNGGDDLPVDSNGPFSFTTQLDDLSGYSVSVLSHPGAPAQTCTLGNESGTLAGGDVTDVSVLCTTNTYTIGGSVSGLAGSGLVLQNNGGDDLAISEDGAFAFSMPLPDLSGFSVSILSQPETPAQICEVSNAAGDLAGADEISVSVSCTTNTYTIGGTVSGLSGSGLVLQNNGGDDLAINANGMFEFNTALDDLSAYAVTVQTPPGSPSQTCMVGNGSGNLSGADVANVTIDCTTDTFTIGGTVSGLAGSGLVLQNNGGDDLGISSNGSFTFTTALEDLSSYSVSVQAQPSNLSQTCVVSNGSGDLAGVDIDSVSVECTTDTFTIGGSVSGLAGSGLVLQNNEGDDLPISGNGMFTFGAALDGGELFDVNVLSQPSDLSQTCTVTSGSGTLAGANVTDVGVECETNTYSVGGSVSGLIGTNLVLQNNGADDVSIDANGDFTFTSQIPDGGMYEVTIASGPSAPAQECSVMNGSGTMNGGAVADVMVMCSDEPQSTIDLEGDLIGIDPFGSVNFNGTCVDPNGETPFTYLWEFEGGPSNRTVEDPGSVSYFTPGVYSVSFTCTDAGGASDPTPATFTVIVNSAPMASIDSPAVDSQTITQFSSETPMNVSQASPTVVSTMLIPNTGVATDVDVLVSATHPSIGELELTLIAPDGTRVPLFTQRGGDGDNLVITLFDEEGGKDLAEGNAPFTGTFNPESPLAQLAGMPAMGEWNLEVVDTNPMANDGSLDDWAIRIDVVDVVNLLQGDEIEFAASCDDPDVPLQHMWDFDGGAPSVFSEDPGKLVFNASGTFLVSYNCTDALGRSPAMPPSVFVEVAPSFQVSGTVTGLIGGVLVLRDQSGDLATFAQNGMDVLSDPLADGSDYDIAVASQPQDPPQSCSVSNSSGTISGADVSNVLIECTPQYSLEGIVGGLEGEGLVLANNGGDQVEIDASGNFIFPTLIGDGEAYNVSIQTQPDNPGQTCTVTNGSGNVVGANVSDVQIDCTTDQYMISGTATGVLGMGMVVQNNGGDDVIIGMDGGFSFPAALDDDSSYAVSIVMQPSSPTQFCQVFGGSGIVSGADVTNVLVSCAGEPAGTIDSPAQAMVQIEPGQSANFSASCADPIGDTPLSHAWDFDGAAPASIAEDPGSIVFASSGLFTVSYTCTNNSGIPDPVPPTVTVDVGHAPVASIDSPIGPESILVESTGGPMSDSMEVSSTLSVASGRAGIITDVRVRLSVAEAFGGELDLVLESPEGERFTLSSGAGDTFTDTEFHDGAGMSVEPGGEPYTDVFQPEDLLSALHGQSADGDWTLTVTGPGGIFAGVNLYAWSLEFTIDDSWVNSGESVVFEGTCGDLDGTEATGHRWNLGGAGPDRVVEDPGAVALNGPAGTYIVTYECTDPTGRTSGASATSITIIDSHRIAGTVTGLEGTGLVLSDQFNTELSISPAGGGDVPFVFPTWLPVGTEFEIQVANSPSSPEQVCSLTDASGTIGGVAPPVLVECSRAYRIRGTVSGLLGNGLVLNSGSAQLPVFGNGDFTFPLQADDTEFNVVIDAQPGTPSQTCNVSNGSGTIMGADATGVLIECSTDFFTVGGTVTGLLGSGLVLQNNGGDDLAIDTDGGFTFATPVEDLSAYSVSVQNQPAGPAQVCQVVNGQGTLTGEPVDDVLIACRKETFTLGGMINGLAGTGLILGNESAEVSQSLENQGAGGVAEALEETEFLIFIPESGKLQRVQVEINASTPIGTANVRLFLASPSGAVVELVDSISANLTDTVFDDTAPTPISAGSGTFTGSFRPVEPLTNLLDSGVSGPWRLYVENLDPSDNVNVAGWSIQIDYLAPGAEMLPIASDGTFVFQEPMTEGSAYSVSVVEQPTNLSQTCTVINADGVFGADDVSAIAVTCTTNSFTVGGSVIGLVGSGLTLQNNGGDDVVMNADNGFVFSAPVEDGQPFSVAISQQPTSPAQVCGVRDGVGILAGENFSGVLVDCRSEPDSIIESPGDPMVFLDPGESVTFEGTCFDAQSDIPFSFDWDFDGGAANATVEDPGSTAFSISGAYDVSFTCTDSVPSSDPTPATRNIIVTQAPDGAIDSPVALSASYDATDVPVAIVDSGTFSSELVIPEDATLQDLNVTLDITHTWDSDLTATLIAPDGTRVELFSSLGSSGDDFTSTVLDDEAASAISSGSPPFTGTFRPAEALSALDGKSTAGTWTLEIVDSFSFDDGTLNSWSLDIDAGTGSVLQGTGIELAATCSDPDGNTPLIHTWDLGGAGSNLSVEDPGLVQLDTVGDFTITYTCTDALGRPDPMPASVDITVQPSFDIGGMVTGLTGSGLVLQNNGGDDLMIAANGAFVFDTPLADGGDYAAGILSQPTSPDQVCAITSGAGGTVMGTDVTDITVECIETRSIGGTVSGLVGSGLTLQINGGDDLSVGADGAFSFATRIVEGEMYDVTVLSQPESPPQFCSVSNGAGTAGATDVTDVLIECQNYYSIGGTVSGLAGSGLMIQNNGGDDFAIDSDGAYAFPMLLLDGESYSVSVSQQPVNLSQTCAVSNASGMVSGSDVIDVDIDCETNQYTIGGEVVGLLGSGMVIQANGTDDLIVDAQGPFTFATPIVDGSGYTVSILTQPSSPSQNCIVNNAMGTLAGANISDVQVACSAPPTSVIDLPVTDQTVHEGDAVLFTGACSDPESNTPFTHEWELDGDSRSSAEDPGMIEFPTAGSFQVTYRCRDSLGYWSMADSRMIEVRQRPVGMIDSPTVSGSSGSYASVDVPVAIGAPALYTSTLDVADALNIGDVNVSLDIAHTYDADLVATIVHPDGTRVELFSNVGGSSDNFTGTTLDDEAGTPITAGSAPFSGTYSPESPLSALDGKDAAGTWTLEIEDVFAGDTGTLNSWNLELAYDSDIDGPVPEGTQIELLASCMDPDGDVPLSHEWDLGGAGMNQLVEDPGIVTLNNPGSFTVTYTCTDSFGGDDADPPSFALEVLPLHEIGGSVSGLAGGSVTLQNNAGDDLVLSSNGAFAFPREILDGSSYDVTVLSNPVSPAQTCVVSSGAGSAQADVSDVSVECTFPPAGQIDSPADQSKVNPGQTLDFTASCTDVDDTAPFAHDWDFGGAAPGGSTLEDPGELLLDTPGTFTVTYTCTDALGVPDATPQTIEIAVNAPPMATIDTPASSVTIGIGKSVDFTATCSDPDGDTPFTHAWDFDGGAAAQTVEDPGSVTFATLGTYTVSYNCTDALSLEDSTPPSVEINVVPEYSIGGTVTNLVGSGLTLQNNGGDDLSIGANGMFTFSQNVPEGLPYDVTVLAEPTMPGQSCLVENGMGSVSADVTDVVVNCIIPPEGSIDQPAMAVKVNPGDPIGFASSCTDADANLPLTHLWDFDGGAPDSTLEDPTSVAFSTPGEYLVTYTCTDAEGVPDASPETVTVTVNDPPVSSIDLPEPQLPPILMYSSTDVPVTISSSSTPTVFSTLNVADDAEILDLNISLDITHTFDADLIVTLTSPAGTEVELFNSVGGPSENFTGTTLDDEAGTSISSGSAPFTGSFQPSEALSAFDGESSMGEWTLEINDTFNGDGGSLNTWSLEIEQGDVEYIVESGSAVTFEGTCTDPDMDTPLSHVWDFDGGAAMNTNEDPGEIILSPSGYYTVSYTCTDALGLSASPTPTFEIKVMNPPTGTIDLPVTDVRINPGESVEFASSCADPDGNTPLTHAWDFSGGAAPSTAADPGMMTFADPGDYLVTYTCTNSMGDPDESPPTVTVSVNQRPVPTIESPPAAGSYTWNSADVPSPVMEYFTIVSDLSIPVQGVIQDVNVNINLYHQRSTWQRAALIAPDGTRVELFDNIRRWYDPDYMNTTLDDEGDKEIQDFYSPVPDSFIPLESLSVFDGKNSAGTWQLEVENSWDYAELLEWSIEIEFYDPVVQTGDSLDFQGNCTDPDGDTPVGSLWDFDGLAPDSMMEDPGEIVLSPAGNYVVTLSCTDSEGVTSMPPATLNVEVNDPPDGSIDMLAAPPVITAGQSVDFSSSCTDPEGDAPLSHQWDFDGGAVNVTDEDPGTVMFDTPGLFSVSYTCIDSNGFADPTPATVLVNVNGPPVPVIDSPVYADSASYVSSDVPVQDVDFGTVYSDLNVMTDLRVTDVNISYSVSAQYDVNDLTGRLIGPDGTTVLLFDRVGGVTNGGFNGTTLDDEVATAITAGSEPFSGSFQPAGSLAAFDGKTSAGQWRFRLNNDWVYDHTLTAWSLEFTFAPILITQGDELDFQGTCDDPNEDTPYTHLWDFGGGASNSTMEDPGPVEFNAPGSFVVSYTCTDGTGMPAMAPATASIDVNPAWSVGGMVSGLTGIGLTLQNNGGDDLVIGADGTYAFDDLLEEGESYNVTIAAQPTVPHQLCTVSNPSGTMGTAAVTNIDVSCVNSYAVEGTVSGMNGTGLVLQNSGGDDLVIDADGPFMFSTTLLDGASYSVTVASQPGSPADFCSVTNGSGMIATADVTNVMVDCVLDAFSVGGTISGLEGSGLTLASKIPASYVGTESATLHYDSTDVPKTYSGFNWSVTSSLSIPDSGTVNDVNVTIDMNTGADGRLDLDLLHPDGTEVQLFDEYHTWLDDYVDTTFDDEAPIDIDSASPPHTGSWNPDGSAQLSSLDNKPLAGTWQLQLYSHLSWSSGVSGTLTDWSLDITATIPSPDRVMPAMDGPYEFPIILMNGDTYDVSIETQPTNPSQTCTLTGNTAGTIMLADVTNVDVSCVTNSFTIGGTVSGLLGSGLVIRNNGGDDIPIGADGSFTFATALEDLSAYEVTVASQPTGPNQICSVTNGMGNLAGADATDVQIDCVTVQYTIGGNVSGLSGSGLVLQNNGGDDLPIAADGSFTFSTPIDDGTSFSVSIAGVPTGPTQACEIANGVGSLMGANVTNVNVTCNDGHFIGGTVSGLTGSGLVLRNNGRDDLPISADGSFEFFLPVEIGGNYLVTVASHPDGPTQLCTITNEAGTVASSDVTDVMVSCQDAYRIGGTVSGLNGTGLVLQNNGGDPTPIDGNGTFEFFTPLLDGESYDVSVSAIPQSPSQICELENSTGMVASAAVTDISVICRNTWFVDASNASGNEDGTNWATAFTSIQDAVDAANSGEQVWVAGGTYLSTADTVPVLNTKSGVDLYGGFAGGEITMEARLDPSINASVLDGDRTDNGWTTDDAYHVVRLRSNVTFDGFTVKGGYASTCSGDEQNGGGIYASGATGAVLRNLVIEGNRANYGAGFYGGGVELRDSIIRNNRAIGCDPVGGSGGGLLISYSVVDQVIFENNHAEKGQAGCCFIYNSGYGGAINAGGNLFVTNSIFRGNTSYRGGGAFFIYGYNGMESPEFDQCLFENNSSVGGVYHDIWSPVRVTNSIIRNNSSGFYVNSGHISVANSLIIGTAGRVATAYGTQGAVGQIYLGSSTIVDNGEVGIGNNQENGGVVTVSGSAIWGNGALVSGNFNMFTTCSQDWINPDPIERNVLLDGSTQELGNPFVETADGHYFLSQMAAGQAFTSVCVDRDDDPPPGGTYNTTRSDLMDETNTDDAGVHYRADEMVIYTFSADATNATWTSIHADSCEITNDADASMIAIDETDLDGASVAHGQGSGTELTMTCRQEGQFHPSVATTTVP